VADRYASAETTTDELLQGRLSATERDIYIADTHRPRSTGNRFARALTTGVSDRLDRAPIAADAAARDEDDPDPEPALTALFDVRCSISL
jgi:hypothetical protein